MGCWIWRLKLGAGGAAPYCLLGTAPWATKIGLSPFGWGEERMEEKARPLQTSISIQSGKKDRKAPKRFFVGRANGGRGAWKKVLEAKYGKEELGWRTRKVNGAFGVGVWKEILKESTWCWENMGFKVGKGNRIRFWTDLWCGNNVLSQGFPNLFSMAAHRNVTVEECWDQNMGQGGWNLGLLRDLNDWEWVFPNSVKEVLSSWKGSFVEEKKEVWKSIPLFIFWTIWKERNRDEEPLSLREIREGERVDLFCKILHICEVTKDEWIIFVWDGTDTPPVSVQTVLEDEMDNPLPLQLESFPLSRDICVHFLLVGTILRVIVDQGSEKLSLHLLKVGKWVRFLKIICEVQAGLWRGVLMPSTKLRYMPDADLLVSQRQRFYDERLSSKMGADAIVKLSLAFSYHRFCIVSLLRIEFFVSIS
ncbi:Protection of telomeres protein 1b [Vitis vinifera]|uniref:Protection of telomeres protein 1b n=1 Tax=Vitis vinifera TaxID=29760 RepID=A0A438EY84_VITVI|nr:Protection of telomeres protein 1b [Vitis vinifera]